MNQGIIFSILMTLFGGDPLEISTGQLPDGRIVVVALTEGPPNQLVSLVQIEAGTNLSAANFAVTQFDAGNIFSISPELISASGFLYMAAVCDLAACMYRLDETNPSSWTKNADVAGTALGGAQVHGVTLNAFGALLALSLHTPNALYFMQADPTVAFAALAFTIVNTINNVASPFDGGTKVSTAIDPNTNDRCLIYRELVTLAVIGNLVAHCFAGTSALAAVTTLETLNNATGFVNSIESRALFQAGAFYFMYFLATGSTQLAVLTDPFNVASLAFIQLGLINLATGFPSMSLVLGPAGESLYAFWPGSAVAITLATLSLQQLAGFPINDVGPMAALAVFTTVLTIAIFGAGSVVGTIMTEGTVAPNVVAVPFLSSPTLIALVLLILAMALWQFRRVQPDHRS
ncbi:MAG: hypothetical protein AAGH65_02035 [Pseudomonadota bacterium]